MWAETDLSWGRTSGQGGAREARTVKPLAVETVSARPARRDLGFLAQLGPASKLWIVE